MRARRPRRIGLTSLPHSTDEHVRPDAAEKEKSGERPAVELIQKMGEHHINASELERGATLAGRSCS